MKLCCNLPGENVEVEILHEQQNSSVTTADEKRRPNYLFIYCAYRWNVYAWRLREYAIAFESTSEKKQWAELLGEALSSWGKYFGRYSIYYIFVLAQKQRPKRLLIFINPFGGKGTANNTWAKKVRTFILPKNFFLG